jgi:hypothetical protein
MMADKVISPSLEHICSTFIALYQQALKASSVWVNKKVSSQVIPINHSGQIQSEILELYFLSTK